MIAKTHHGKFFHFTQIEWNKIMNSDSRIPDKKNILNLTDVQEESPVENHQNVIVVDGRGYEDTDKNQQEIYNLVDIIDDAPTAAKIYENIIKQTTVIVERIAREVVPDIAERLIKEEIEKLKNQT